MSFNPNLNNNTPKPEDEIFDFKQILSSVLNNWIWFVGSIVICLIFAYTYAYYSAPIWHISSKILVLDEKNSPSTIGGAMGGELGSLFNAKSNSDNEIQILKSRTLMKKTVDAMQLNLRVCQCIV
jgi:tyrosine-protein kinase Etk/Wzc